MRRVLPLAMLLMVFGCKTTTPTPTNTPATQQPSNAATPLFGPHGFDLTGLDTEGYAPLFRVGGQNDFKNSRMIIASVGTGQLGLPDRDYYLRSDERFATIRGQYVDHVAKMLSLAGEEVTQARADAQRVLDLETKLAQAEMSRAELRNPENRYHMMAVSQLAATAPVVDW